MAASLFLEAAVVSTVSYRLARYHDKHGRIRYMLGHRREANQPNVHTLIALILQGRRAQQRFTVLRSTTFLPLYEVHPAM